MKSVCKPLLMSLAVSTLVNGCAIKPHSEEIKYGVIQDKARTITEESAATYVREVTPEEQTYRLKVSYVGTATLIDAIREQLPRLNIMVSKA